MARSLERVGPPSPEDKTFGGTWQVTSPPGKIHSGLRRASRMVVGISEELFLGQNEQNVGDMPGTSLGGEQPTEVPYG